MSYESSKPVRLVKDAEITNEVLQLIRTAQKEIILVSPYNQHWPALARGLEDARQRGVKVEMYYREEKEDPAQDYNGVASFPVYRLHAKIYANENTVLVTSMNLTESSGMNSREVGLLVQDTALFREISGYMKTLRPAVGRNLETATQNNRQEQQQTVTAVNPVRERQQNCIVCGKKRSYNPLHLLCRDCWEENPGYCIHCGDMVNVNIVTPFCQTCRLSHRREQHGYCHLCRKEAVTDVKEPLCEECSEKRSMVLQ